MQYQRNRILIERDPLRLDECLQAPYKTTSRLGIWSPKFEGGRLQRITKWDAPVQADMEAAQPLILDQMEGGLYHIRQSLL